MRREIETVQTGIHRKYGGDEKLALSFASVRLMPPAGKQSVAALEFFATPMLYPSRCEQR
jgi:hypothetical protein